MTNIKNLIPENITTNLVYILNQNSNSLNELILPGIAILISSISIIISIIAVNQSRKSTRHTVLSNLIEVFRSEKMADYIKSLWDYFKLCNSNEIEMIKRYENDYILLNNGLKLQNTHIHYMRRYVSQYFLEVALYEMNGILPLKNIYQLWKPEAIEILPKIIIPIDMELPRIIGSDSKKEDVYILENFYKKIIIMKSKKRNKTK